MTMRLGSLMIVVVGCLLISCDVGKAEDSHRPTDPVVARFIKQWKEGDRLTRLQVLQRLGRIGHRCRSTVPELITGLSDPLPEIRAATAEALGKIGSQNANPALIKALGDPELAVRTATAAALARTRPDSRLAIPALAAAVRADPSRFGEAAVAALAAMGEPAVPLAIELLHETNPRFRKIGLQLLAGLGSTAKETVPILIETFHKPDPVIRVQAAQALGAIGESAIDALVRALRDRDPKVRGGAALALELIGESAWPAIPALIAAMAEPVPPDDPRPPESLDSDDGSSNPHARPSPYQAALVAIGSASVPALLKQLDCSDHAMRVQAVRTLGFLQDQGKSAVPRLIGLLGHSDIRAEATIALGRIGAAARPAVPMLIAMSKNRDSGLRCHAAEALGQISSQVFHQWTAPARKSVIDALTLALRDQDLRVRLAAVSACAQIGQRIAPTSPQLVPLLADPDIELRLATLRALEGIVEHSGPTQKALVHCLGDADHRIRRAAAHAVSHSDLNSDTVIAGLIAALNDQDVEVRAAAAGRLVCTNGRGGISLAEGTLDPTEADSTVLARSPTAAACLRAALADPDRRVRAAAAYILPVFKQEAATAIPLLTERLGDPAVIVRLAAARSLGQFGKEARSALPALLKALADPGSIRVNRFNVSTKAAEAVLAISPDDQELIFDRLLAALADPRQSVNEAAADTLRNFKFPASQRLYRALADSAAGLPIKRRIVEILATEEMGGGGETVLDGTTVAKREAAARAAIPVLAQLADDPNEDVCLNAIRILAVLDPRNHPMPRLILDAVSKAAISLEQLEFAFTNIPSSDAPVLMERLKDPNPNVRTVAAYAIADMAFGQQQALLNMNNQPGEQPDAGKPKEDKSEQELKARIMDALIARLGDPDNQVRWAAAWAIGSLVQDLVAEEQKPPPRALPALLAILRDRSTRMNEDAWIRVAEGDFEQGLNAHTTRTATTEQLRIVAIQAISAFGANAASAVPDLVEALKDSDADVRRFAAMALGLTGPPASAAVPDLVALLQSTDQPLRTPVSVDLANGFRYSMTIRYMAARALGKIGPEARAAIPILIKLLDDRDMMLRWAAAGSLAEIGPRDSTVLLALERAMNDTTDENLAQRAATALRMIGEAAVPVLLNALHSRDPDVRGRAAGALAQIGTPAMAVIPDLERAAKLDDDSLVRQVLEGAIQQIRNSSQEGQNTPDGSVIEFEKP